MTKDQAYAEMIRHAADMNMTVEELLEGADNFVQYGDYLSDGAKWEGMSLDETFWDAYEVYRDKLIPENRRHSFFSCSC